MFTAPIHTPSGRPVGGKPRGGPHLRDVRPTIAHKGRVWGIAELTDLHPTETMLSAIPGIAPATPLHRIKVRDIAIRLAHIRTRPPNAQTTWPSKLGFAAGELTLNWNELYKKTFTRLLIPRDRDVFLKLIHRATSALFTGGYCGRVCPHCQAHNYNLLHIAQCAKNDPIFRASERVIAAIERITLTDPNPPVHAQHSATDRKKHLAQRILAFQFNSPTTLSEPMTLRRASTAVYALTWDRIYKTSASAAIEAQARRDARDPNAPLSPMPHSQSTTNSQNATITLILTTLQTRVLGFAKMRARQAAIATALGNTRDARKSVNRELRGLAHITKNGTLVLEDAVRDEINAIKDDLGLDNLQAMRPTRIIFPHANDSEESEDSDLTHTPASIEPTDTAPRDRDAHTHSEDSDHHLPYPSDDPGDATSSAPYWNMDPNWATTVWVDHLASAPPTPSHPEPHNPTPHSIDLLNLSSDASDSELAAPPNRITNLLDLSSDPSDSEHNSPPRAGAGNMLWDTSADEDEAAPNDPSPQAPSGASPPRAHQPNRHPPNSPMDPCSPSPAAAAPRHPTPGPEAHNPWYLSPTRMPRPATRASAPQPAAAQLTPSDRDGDEADNEEASEADAIPAYPTSAMETSAPSPAAAKPRKKQRRANRKPANGRQYEKQKQQPANTQ